MSKKNYLCLQRTLPSKGEQSSSQGGKPSAAEMQEMYAKFNAWKNRFQDNIVDMGGRLKSGKIATVDGVVDGPFAESKELIGGFMVISAETLDEAVEVASGCPGLVTPGSGVEVREINSPG